MSGSAGTVSHHRVRGKEERTRSRRDQEEPASREGFGRRRCRCRPQQIRRLFPLFHRLSLDSIQPTDIQVFSNLRNFWNAVFGGLNPRKGQFVTPGEYMLILRRTFSGVGYAVRFLLCMSALFASRWHMCFCFRFGGYGREGIGPFRASHGLLHTCVGLLRSTLHVKLCASAGRVEYPSGASLIWAHDTHTAPERDPLLPSITGKVRKAAEEDFR
ncbi:hypothetical protein OPV22_034020 [Ensete ventricosum]|uniref:Uncharacterized protein n=1 Tax=Ensete ventricosum TaxID=4639 RepID=A0AAV8PNT6_ENSVE|nr:hypothetical protein OPV22_034020 [Ensete ventricosum]